MGATYATCKSYLDSGVVTNFDKFYRRAVVKPFRTAFVRPDRFRFEFDDPTPQKRYVVWTKGSDIRTWWYASSGIKRQSSIDLAVAGATGASGGSAHTVPALLLPDRISGAKLTGMINLKRSPNATLDGTPCFQLQGDFAGRPTTVWLEKKTYLIRRIYRDSGLTKDTLVYRPQVNIQIPTHELEFDAPKKR